MSRSRSGFSLPFVLIFCIGAVLMLMALVYAKTSGANQSKAAFARIKAHYMTQAGVQHALLKLRILPNESFDAACLLRGICPFLPPGTASGGTGTTYTEPNDEFKIDVTTEAHPIHSDFRSDFDDWTYEPVEIKPIMAQTKGDERIHAVEIVMHGKVATKVKGISMDVHDEVKRVIKVSRKF